MKKIHYSKKNLIVRVENDSRTIFYMKCINLLHFYVVLGAIQKLLKGQNIHSEFLKNPKGKENVQNEHT